MSNDSFQTINEYPIRVYRIKQAYKSNITVETFLDESLRKIFVGKLNQIGKFYRPVSFILTEKFLIERIFDSPSSDSSNVNVEPQYPVIFK